jgi:hypothetical protein
VAAPSCPHFAVPGLPISRASGKREVAVLFADASVLPLIGLIGCNHNPTNPDAGLLNDSAIAALVSVEAAGTDRAAASRDARIMCIARRGTSPSPAAFSIPFASAANGSPVTCRALRAGEWPRNLASDMLMRIARGNRADGPVCLRLLPR